MLSPEQEKAFLLQLFHSGNFHHLKFNLIYFLYNTFLTALMTSSLFGNHSFNKAGE